MNDGIPVSNPRVAPSLGLIFAHPSLKAPLGRSFGGTAFHISEVGSASVAFGAGDILFSLRNASSTRLVIIRHLAFVALCEAAASAAGSIALAWRRVSTYSADATGGTAITPSKDDTSDAAATCSLRIAAAAAVVAGTRTPDTSSLKGNGLAVKIGDQPTLFSDDDLDDAVIILRQNEGLELFNRFAVPAGITFRPQIELSFCEIGQDANGKWYWPF